MACRRRTWKYCAAVLGPLALEPVGEQERERRLLGPLVLSGHDVLIDDDLRTVREVAELRLPRHEGSGIGDRVAVLEPQCCVLGEHRVVEPERRLVR